MSSCLLFSLPVELAKQVVSRLEEDEKLLFSTASNASYNFICRIQPSFRVRCTEAAQARTLALFVSVDGVPFNHPSLMKATMIASNPLRAENLKSWLLDQQVGIDKGGFFTLNESFRGSRKQRIRISLWDCPLEVGYVSHPSLHETEYEPVTRIKKEFARLGYNP